MEAPQTPEECDALFAKNLNAGNVDGVVALYEPNGVLVLETTATGLAQVKEALTALASVKPTMTMNVVRVIRSGDDLAMVYNDWSMTGTGPDGTRIEDEGKAIEVVRRQADGSWRYVLDDPRARG